MIQMKYWSGRQEQYYKNLEKDEKKLQSKLRKMYNDEARKLEKEVGSYYSKYGKDNVIEYKELLIELDIRERKLLYEDMEEFFNNRPELEHLRSVRESHYKIDRLEAIEYNILKQQAKLADVEIEMVEEHLVKHGTKIYNDVLKDMGYTNLLIGPNDVMMKELVNQKWLNDKNFSNRIWEHKEKVTDFLYNDFRNGVIRGDNYNKMGGILKSRFKKQSNFNIKRLVYTEGTFVQNQSMAKSFESGGYISYFYDAILDDRTSDICESLHGEEFLFKDKISGVNFPPMHPFCRSSFQVNTKNQQDITEDEVVQDMGYEETKEVFKSVRYNGIDKEYSTEIDKQLLDLQNNYPINKKNIEISARKAKNYLGQYSYGISTSKRKGNTYVQYRDRLTLSNIHHKNSDISEKVHLNNYKHRGSKLRSHLATVDHEYGHAIDVEYALSKNPEIKELANKFRKLQPIGSIDTDEAMKVNGFLKNSKDSLSSEIYKELQEEYGYTPREMYNKVRSEFGSYACSDEKEFLAEGFANMRHIPEDEKSEFLREFETKFNKKFNEVIRNGTD